jgi:membrane protease YdiL (CAAX protease family)
MTTIAIAVLMGIVVLLAGNLPWGVLLVPLNLRVARVVPWAVLPMAIYLWCYWKHIGGSWGSKATAGERRANLRANALSVKMWGASLAAGLLGFATIAVMLVLMARLTNLPSSAPLMVTEGMPSITVFVLVVMSSVVAGVTEEAAFRGYMQGPSNGDTVWLSPFSLTGRRSDCCIFRIIRLTSGSCCPITSPCRPFTVD